MWVFKLTACENDFSHESHLWYFLFSWTILTCEFNCLWSLKKLWQILQQFQKHNPKSGSPQPSDGRLGSRKTLYQTLPETQRTQIIGSVHSCNLHWFKIWSSGGTTCIASKVGHQVASLALPNCLGLPCWHYQLVLSWYHHQPESHQLSLNKVILRL